MDFLEDIGGLLTANVEFNGNDALETLTEEYGNAVSKITKSAIEYGTLAGDNEGANKSGKALIKLAGKIGEAFPKLTDEQVEAFKGIVDEVSDSADPAVDAAARNLFNDAVDGVRAAQKLSDHYNNPPVVDEGGDDTGNGGNGEGETQGNRRT